MVIDFGPPTLREKLYFKKPTNFHMKYILNAKEGIIEVIFEYRNKDGSAYRYDECHIVRHKKN